MRTLYRAARVHTFGHPRTGEWLLIDDRHVQRVGTGDPPAADRIVELPGATIMPGFIDAHVHLTSTGAAIANDDVAAARSRAELLAIAATRAAGETERVVALQGYDETRWGDPTLPALAELDAITADPLVIRRADGHTALVNSAALTFAAALEARGVERDAKGSPTGRVTQEANQLVGLWVATARTVHHIEELQLLGAGLAAMRGVTTVHEMALPRESGMRDVEVLLAHRARLPLAVVVVLGTMDVPKAAELGLGAIGGDLAVDGSIGARTAALSLPYADGTGRGVTYFDDEVLEGFFHDGHEAGLQVGMHAIGDRAIEQVLTAWEHVYQRLDSRERRHFRARRHRIEHFEMPSAEQVERTAMLGLAVSMQPSFDLAWGHPGALYAQGVGAERAGAMNPVRLLLERGVVLGVGSDAPVVPMDPWLTIHALEHHHDPTQQLTRIEAIQLHTAGSARLAHQEEKKGILEPGMHADLAAYDTDPLEAPDVRALRPILTVSLGREVWLA
ncbi:MAG: amidohydrolase family protein [Actinomycetota bacterium]